MPDAAAQLHSTIPPELKAILVQQLVDWGVAAVRSGWRRWWYTFSRIDKQEALYKWYLKEFVGHFSTIETLDQLVPFTGSLGVDRFLLWPELDEETRRSADKPNDAERDRKPPLLRKLKATELLTHPLSNKRLFAVEGAAGVGKTTMARALARFAATQTLELMERENEDGSQVQYLPLYFNAEDLIKLAKSGQEDQDGPNGEGALKNLLGGVLQKPNRALLVIVDGLDEVEGPIRTKALIALRGLWLPGGSHRYLLLGRPGSIRNVTWVREEEAALKLSLKPWGKEAVREYLGRWTEEGGRPHLEAAELDQLVEYIRSRVGLPSPALLVQMVVASYVELKRDGLENPLERMPATRTELYRHYLRLLLERSEDDKALQGAGSTAHPADPERRKWLGCLELLLRLSPKQRERARAQKCSANHLPDAASARVRGRSCGKLLREEADFTKWWEDRKLCRLGHESLHEFLAAEALARLYQGDPQRFWKDWLHPSIFDPYWQQTLIFAMALMDEDDQNALMHALLALGSCDPISKQTKRHLEVMAKAWSVGVRYLPAAWQKWLDSDPGPGLLGITMANCGLRILALKVLDRLARERASGVLQLDAAKALGKFKPELAMSVLKQLVQSGEDEWVWYEALALLVKLEPELAAVALEQLVWEGKNERMRREALEAFGRLGRVAIPALKRLVRDCEDEWVQLEAAKVLVGISPRCASSALKGLAQETGDKWIRLNTAKALVELDHKYALHILKQLALNIEDDWIRLNTAKALVELDHKYALHIFEQLARESKYERVRLEAADEITGMNPPLATYTFEQLARDGRFVWVRTEAAKALGRLKPVMAIPILEQLARDALYEEARKEAVEALGRLGSMAVFTVNQLTRDVENIYIQHETIKTPYGYGPLVMPSLERLAREGKDERVRFEAAEALGKLDPELAMSILERLALGAKEERVQRRAVMEIGALGPEAVPALERLAREGKDERVRFEAAEALGKLDPELAMPILERLAREGKDERVRYRAAWILKKLGVPPMGCVELTQELN